MALTEFGKAVRKARIDTGYTLLTMAKALGTTSAFLSGLETGSKKFLLSGYRQSMSFSLSKVIILRTWMYWLTFQTSLYQLKASQSNNKC